MFMATNGGFLHRSCRWKFCLRRSWPPRSLKFWMRCSWFLVVCCVFFLGGLSIKKSWCKPFKPWIVICLSMKIKEHPQIWLFYSRSPQLGGTPFPEPSKWPLGFHGSQPDVEKPWGKPRNVICSSHFVYIAVKEALLTSQLKITKSCQGWLIQFLHSPYIYI